MKNLMNKLGMLAILAALGFAGYVVVNNCMKNADYVKIQGRIHEGDHGGSIGDRCLNGSDCQSHSCGSKQSGSEQKCLENSKYPSN